MNFGDPYGLYSLSDFGYDVANLAIGIGDVASFGVTKWIRSQGWYGGDCFTDKSSAAYKIGELAGFAALLIITSGGSSEVEAAGAVESVPEAELSGQMHHAMSRRIYNALEEHPNLAGEYAFRDSRWVTQARNLEAHIGYQQWHRDLDVEIANWINRESAATTSQFERYLTARYAQPDLLWRFPNGF